MDDAIRAMIEKRRPRDEADWERALREVLQEAALAGLWRRGFFDQAAFYGGTALRLYGSGGGQARGRHRLRFHQGEHQSPPRSHRGARAHRRADRR